MLLKALGAIDVVGGLILVFGTGVSVPKAVLLIFGLILLVKSALGMLKDFGSWIDLVSGIVFLIWIFVDLPDFIGFGLGILLLQKGIFSFI